jgi:primosomal protein N' (replication factor Y)
MKNEWQDIPDTHIAQAVFVDVVLPLYLPQLYTYRVPEDLVPYLEVGKRIVVQFGSKKIYSAIIWEIHNRVPQVYEAKYILSVVDDQPIVNKKQLDLWQWISNYYMCSLGEVMNAAMPAGLKLESETKITLKYFEDIDYSQLTDHEFLIIEALELQKELTIKKVCEILELSNVYKILKSLFYKELILVKEELNEKYTQKQKECIRLSQSFNNDDALNHLFDTLEKKAPKQSEVLMLYIQQAQSGKPVEKAVLSKISTANNASSAIHALIEKGVFESYKLDTDRLIYNDQVKETFELNAEQTEAYQKILETYKEKNICLLHGVTGSGKTHIYAQLIQETINQGKQVLYLLPEIALTGQMIKRLKKYFGNQIMLSHSKFNENERVEIWNKLADHKIKIIMGARSALFLPFSNLGLVIVDEEHESSYKQQDPAPRYQARDTAMVLAQMHQAKVLLGSATPAVETFYSATHGKYGYVTLFNRFGGSQLPDIELADVGFEKRTKTFKYNFTSQLLNEMEKQLADEHQIILFQNRRGYVPQIECATCNWIPKCKHCDITLTYHKYNHTLKCHYCGYKEDATGKCGACGSTDIGFKGFGTEKIEDDLKTILPDARVARLDLETTRTKTGHQKIITDLEERRTDILIGTQMVSKGLDFENVSLVGIMNADQLLHFPDFRANERSFQLLSQVSGRSGRRLIKGKVIIQTSTPNHQVLFHILQHSYQGFYDSEIIQRQKFNYPPFTRLIKLTLKSKDHQNCLNAAKQLGSKLKQILGKRVIGPEKPLISKLQDYYIQSILIKVERENVSISQVKELVKKQMEHIYIDYKKLYITVDVDPY